MNKFKKLRKQALTITGGLVATSYKDTQKSKLFDGQKILNDKCTRSVYQKLKAAS